MLQAHTPMWRLCSILYFREVKSGMYLVANFTTTTRNPAEITDLRARLISNVALLNAFNSALTAGNSSATQAGVDELLTHQKDQKYQSVLEWLSPSDFPTQQNQFFRYCQAGTGKWLLESREFTQWLNADALDSTLFCPGIPGAGKTMLTAIIVHYLQDLFRDSQGIGIAYIYCNYKRQAEQSTEFLVASLLKQLAWAQSYLSAEISNIYNNHTFRQRQPSLDDITHVLGQVVRGYSRTFIIIGALDEMTSTGGSRSKSLQAISTIQNYNNVNVFVTSRHFPDITAHFRGSLTLVPQIRCKEICGESLERLASLCSTKHRPSRDHHYGGHKSC